VVASRPPHESVTVHGNAEHTAHQRVNRIATLPDTEVEYRRRVTRGAAAARIAEQYFGEACFAHAGIGADQDDSAFLRGCRMLQQPGKALPLALSAEQRLLHRVGCAKRSDAKCRRAIGESMNRNGTQRI